MLDALYACKSASSAYGLWIMHQWMNHNGLPRVASNFWDVVVTDSHKALTDSHVYHVVVLFQSLYTGTVVDSFLLPAGSPSVQLAFQAREARNQGKYTILSIASCFSSPVHSFCFFAVPLLCLATNDNSPSMFQQMPPKRVTWTEDDTKLLLDLCLQEKEKCNFTQQGLTTASWSNVYTNFPNFDKK